MDRRHFLATAALLGAGALLVLRTGMRTGDGMTPIEAVRLIGGDGDAMGDAYLALVPEEGDIGRLSRLLFPGSSGSPGSRTGDDWLRYLADRVREDFAEGDTVLLEGWLLSRTEARASALARLA